jgi:nucleoside-diphosphate-sugar epimerase
MQILITGAGGFIGSHLVEDQLRRGHEVTALDIHPDVLRSWTGNPNLKVVEGDFTDRERIDPLLDGQEVVFHLASAHLEKDVDEGYFFRVNVQGARDFVERCQKAGVRRFVHCSSVGVYGDIKNPPADENSETHPDVPYEKSKLAGEKAILEYVQNSGYNLVIVRPAWVYGPRCPRTERLFRTIKKGRFFFVGDGNTMRHPIYIDDMSEGFTIAAEKETTPGEIFIIAGPRAVTLRELAGEIARCEGVKPPGLKLPYTLVMTGCVVLEGGAKVFKFKPPFTRRSMKFYTGNNAFTIEKAQVNLGFHPKTELAEGLGKTYQWLKQNNRI